MSFNCEILADSMSPQGHRLTTMKITFPRFILAEFNTHRVFSRNSASSRAIPFEKMLKMVETNPFVPIAFQKDHKGMQGTEYLQGKELQQALDRWNDAKNYAVMSAKDLNATGATKQICNRLLEPFMWHTVIVTSSEWENFFNLRCPQYFINGAYYSSKKDACIIEPEKNTPSLDDTLGWLEINQSQAEIHIQAIAELMWDAYNEITSKQLNVGDWHIPFGNNFDEFKFSEVVGTSSTPESLKSLYDSAKIRIATARCARISYQTLGDDPKIDYAADIRLHDTLYKSGHFSPFEHCAKATDDSNWYGNFRGWNQYRKMLEKNEGQ